MISRTLFEYCWDDGGFTDSIQFFAECSREEMIRHIREARERYIDASDFPALELYLAAAGVTITQNDVPHVPGGTIDSPAYITDVETG